MTIKIRQRYEKESILYTFIRRNVIDWNNVQDFRNASIANIKNNLEGLDKIQGYKDNPSKFLQSQYQNIDMQDFKEVISNVESFYRTSIPDFSELRYYQYITLFITYVFCKLHTQDSFKEEYLAFIANEIFESGSDWDYKHNLDSSFNRLGYWMATASGKTIIMYAIAYMYIKLFSSDIRTLYILVPTDELRNQHSAFLNMFGGLANSDGTLININSLNLFNDCYVDVKLTTITKMLSDENGKNLDNNSIMIFDEAHRGASSTNEDSSTEKLKNEFIKKSNTFLFEFSATFQSAFQADYKRIGDIRINDRNIFDRYIFSSLMKYNLYDFNSDGFGKCYYLNNLSGKDDKTDKGKRELICDSLVHLGLQLFAYDTIKKENPEFTDRGTYIQHTDGTKLYYPLYMGLSRALLKRDSSGEGIDEKAGTSLVDILEHINYIFAHYNEFYDYIDQKIGDLYKDELRISLGRANPEIVFKELTGIDYEEGISVGFRLRYDRQADEVKILLGNKKMLINTGSNNKIADFLQKSIPNLFSFEEQFGTGGRRFTNIDNDKDILYVFGSKKFIEGWDSKRPSTIMLFKMGKSSTIQATQILGRGLRLAGRDGDGFRHISERIKRRPNGDAHHTFLTEYVGMFGYEIEEFKKFIDQISGDILSITIHKGRTYTDSFTNYLQNKGINPTDDKEVDKFLSKNFKYIYQEIERTNPIEGIKVQADIEDKSQVKFYLKRDGGESDAGVIKQSGNFLTSTRETGSIISGTGTLGTATTHITYTYQGLSTLGELGIKQFVKRMRRKYSRWELPIEIRNAIEELISHYTLNTDYISSEQAESVDYMFDMELQNKIVRIFIEHLEKAFESVDSHIHSLKEKEIVTHDGDLKTSNFAEGLKITLSMKKDNDKYKKLLELFEIDETTHQLDDNYDNLNDNQKKMFDPFFATKGADLHFYERLYFIPANSYKDSLEHLHQVEDKAEINGARTDLNDFKADPEDLKLNYNEEHRIEQILGDIKRDSEFSKYDIFYLRNLVGKNNGGIKFAYVENSGEFKYFFPDFLFRFFNKETDERTVIYFEPKSSVDPNRELKEIVLKDIIGKDVDSCIKTLFDNASSGNETFWGGKVL